MELFSTKDIADNVGLSLRQVQNLAEELIEKNHAQRVGSTLVCFKSAINYIKTRPETRGRKPMNMTFNDALEILKTGDENGAWLKAQKDDGLLPEVTKKQWLDFAYKVLKNRG